jgi:hypothetical protein
LNFAKYKGLTTFLTSPAQESILSDKSLWLHGTIVDADIVYQAGKERLGGIILSDTYV